MILQNRQYDNKSLENVVDVPLLLADSGVHRCAGEVALAEELVELGAAKGGANEDDNLVELQAVEEVIELAVLLALIQLHVELLQTVKRELLLVVDINFERILHELLADRTHVLGQRG